MKILIVEDDPFVADDLKDKLAQLNYRVTSIAESYGDALRAIELEKPDLALLDIELKGELTGIDLAKKLTIFGIPFIYLSSIQDLNTYLNAKNTAPLKNLAKPIDLLNLRNALLDIDWSELQSPTTIVSPFEEIANPPDTDKILHFITNKDNIKVRINLDEIVYIEAARSYCVIYFEDGKKSTLASAMGNVIKKIDYRQFIQISRSHCINLKHVKQLRGNEVEMKVGPFLKISDSYKETLNGFLNIL